MKLLVVGMEKIGGRSGETREGRKYNISDCVEFDCIRSTKVPNHDGYIIKKVKVSADSPFYSLIQDCNCTTFVNKTIEVEFEISGKYEKLVEFSFSDEKLDFHVVKNPPVVNK